MLWTQNALLSCNDSVSIVYLYAAAVAATDSLKCSRPIDLFSIPFKSHSGAEWKFP